MNTCRDTILIGNEKQIINDQLTITPLGAAPVTARPSVSQQDRSSPPAPHH